jgi:hypothetical protein
MVIWEGRGIVVFIVFIIACAMAIPISFAIAPAFDISGDRGVRLVFAVALFMAAVVCFPIGRFVMKQREPETRPHPETGEPTLVHLRDSLYWIETRYWGYIFFALALVMIATTYLF